MAKTHYDIAVAEMSKGRLRKALSEALISVDNDPFLSQAHNVLGLIYHALGKSENALVHYDQAIALKPKFSNAHNNRGILLMSMGRFDEAIVSFQVALSDILYATPALAEGNMGWAYYQSGNIVKALKHLRNAVASSPKFCRGYLWLAKMGLDTEDPDLTITSVGRFEKYCASDKQIVLAIGGEYLREMRYYLGLGLLKQGDRKQAMEAFRKCTDGADLEFAKGFAPKCAKSLQHLQ